MPIITTDLLYTGDKRPPEFKDVTIETEVLVIHGAPEPVTRTVSVKGIVYVIGTMTRGEHPTPNSISGLLTTVSSSSTGETRNQGIIDADKGHVMGLQLGGPNREENIVPQWSNWQANGEWRRMEVAVGKMASENRRRGQYLMFHCEIDYLSDTSFLRSAMPRGFQVIVTTLDVNYRVCGPPDVVFYGEQHQDDTDDMISLRTFLELDGDPGYWDFKRKFKKIKSGKIKDKSRFQPSGQDPVHVHPASSSSLGFPSFHPSSLSLPPLGLPAFSPPSSSSSISPSSSSSSPSSSAAGSSSSSSSSGTKRRPTPPIRHSKRPHPSSDYDATYGDRFHLNCRTRSARLQASVDALYDTDSDDSDFEPSSSSSSGSDSDASSSQDRNRISRSNSLS